VVVEDGKHSGMPALLDAVSSTRRVTWQSQSSLKVLIVGDVAVTSIVSATESAQGVEPAEVIDLGNPQTIEPPAFNCCAVTTRRLEEIARRNRIRDEAGLPLLSIPKELRRMKDVADAVAETDQFEAFATVHRAAVWDEVLAPERERRGQPDWRPRRWMEGLGYQTQVSRILRERFLRKSSQYRSVYSASPVAE
jgi:hypothetical protein